MTRRRGNAALEFALLLPIFTALLIGILDFGWLFYHRASLDSATSVGCRAGSLLDPGTGEADMATVQAGAETATADALTGLGIACDGRCRTTAAPFGTNPARSIQCTLQFDFTPLVGIYLDPVTIQSVQVARLEYQR